jgi:hypothetical protein
MDITSPEVKKTYEDYDILFSSGFLMPLVVDPSNGDTIDLEADPIRIFIAPKPTQSDPKKFTQREDIIVFRSHILSIQHRTREAIEPSPEEKHQLAKAFKDLITSSTIH